MKIHPVTAEFFHGDEWMNREDIMKQIAAFCTFANAPKSFDHIAVWNQDTTTNLLEPNKVLLRLSLVLNFWVICLHHLAVTGKKWQHTCPCICSPLLRCPRENAECVHHENTVN
jgi:hypothetical protein